MSTSLCTSCDWHIHVGDSHVQYPIEYLQHMYMYAGPCRSRLARGARGYMICGTLVNLSLTWPLPYTYRLYVTGIEILMNSELAELHVYLLHVLLSVLPHPLPTPSPLSTPHTVLREQFVKNGTTYIQMLTITPFCLGVG